MQNIYVDIREQNEQISKMFNNKDIVSIDEILNKLCDLEDDVNYLQEQFDDLRQDVMDNYVHRPMSDYTGDSEDNRY